MSDKTEKNAVKSEGKPDLKVVEVLYETNFRHVGDSLIAISGEINDGDHGDITEAYIVMADDEGRFCMWKLGPRADDIRATAWFKIASDKLATVASVWNEEPEPVDGEEEDPEEVE